MYDFFQKLNKTSNKEEQIEAIKSGRQKLRQIEGEGKLDFTLRLLKWADRYDLSKFAEEIIDDVIEQAKTVLSEQAALLLVRKAECAFRNLDTDKVSRYADLALKKSRNIGSNEAEAEALMVKGDLANHKKEDEKASAFHTMALAKCTERQRPVFMLNIGSYYLQSQGDYSKAWTILNEAVVLADELSRNQSLGDEERRKCKQTILTAYLELGKVHEGLGDLDGAARAYDKVFSRDKSMWSKEHFLGTAEVLVTHGGTQKLAGEELCEADASDPRINNFLDYCRYRSLMMAKEYEPALNVCREILFGGTDGAQNFKRLNEFMENHTGRFIEIVQRVAISLHALGRISEYENIKKEEEMFCEVRQQIDLHNITDRDYRFRTQKKRLGAALKRIFFKVPDYVEYKNMRAKCYPSEKKATFVFGEEKIRLSRRNFLVFKCLVDNAGDVVTEKMLESFIVRQGETIFGKDSGLRSNVARLKEKISCFAQFFMPKSTYEGKGWMLEMP